MDILRSSKNIYTVQIKIRRAAKYLKSNMNVGLTWRHAMWKSYDIWHFYSLRSPNHLTKLFGSSSKSTTTAVSSSFSSLFGMEYTLPPPVTEAPPCSVASQMMGVEAGLSNFVEQEESSMMV